MANLPGTSEGITSSQMATGDRRRPSPSRAPTDRGIRLMMRPRHRPLLTTALTAACAAALAGCGGQQATKQDVIARGNAICASALQNIRAVPSPAGGSTSLAGLAAYVGQVAPIVDKEARQLRALPKPAEQRALLARYLSAVAADAAEYRTLAAAARAGDSAGVAQALADLRDSQAASLASEYGLTQCAAPGSTAVS
jgi:hypothetical protein